MIDKNLDTSILLNIYETAIQLLRRNNEFVSQEGLTNQQWVVLIYLAKDPNLPFFNREKHDKPLMAFELADAIGVTRANITNLLKALIVKKLVIQTEDEVDRRKKRLKLSPKGEALIKKMQPTRKLNNEFLLEGISKKEKELLLKSLEKLSKNLYK